MSARRGNYSVFFGVTTTMVFGFGALAVDLTYLHLANLEAQALADSASHAAFVAYRINNSASDATAAANLMLQRNTVAGVQASLDGIDLGEWDNGAFSTGGATVNAARVTVGRTGANALDLVLAPIIGVGTQDITANSITSGRTREIMVVQDITGSFFDDIHNARDADVAFIDAIMASPYPGDRIGMSTFVGGVEPTAWTRLQSIADHGASIRSQWSTLASCNCNEDYWDGDWCVTYYGGHNTQPWMQDCFEYGYQTAPGPGIDQAVDELINFGDPAAFQAIILVSDGLPCCGSLTAERTQDGIDAADRAWTNGIHVWTVTYQNGGGDFSYLESLARGEGQAYLTPDPEELEGIMLEIAASIPVVLVE